jgi:integrase
MSRSHHVPTYRRHKQSGQAIVTLPDGLGGRRDILLGQYGTADSRHEYARVLAEWEAAGRCLAQTPAAKDLTCNELMLAYWRHAEGYYVKNGKPTSQLARIKLAFKLLKRLYGHTQARHFGPLALKAVRAAMLEQGWCRGFTNQAIGCIKRLFKWGVENELCPTGVFHGLQAVAGLKKGRTEAREMEPIRPVADEHVDAVLPFVNRAVRAMIQVQRLTGMRPCEVVIVRPCDIDRSRGQTWVYRPESHKTEHHGIKRIVFLGPQAQDILKPFLAGRAPGAYLFSPREMMEERWVLLRSQRKSKVQPSQLSRKKRKPRRQPGGHYLVSSYEHAITIACKRADNAARQKAIECGMSEAKAAETIFVPHWAPNQLRHAKATEIRRAAGLDAARVVLGHRSPQVTEIYAEIDASKAAEIMELLG